jgi:hypothetical protein
MQKTQFICKKHTFYIQKPLKKHTFIYKQASKSQISAQKSQKTAPKAQFWPQKSPISVLFLGHPQHEPALGGPAAAPPRVLRVGLDTRKQGVVVPDVHRAAGEPGAGSGSGCLVVVSLDRGEQGGSNGTG